MTQPDPTNEPRRIARNTRDCISVLEKASKTMDVSVEMFFEALQAIAFDIEHIDAANTPAPRQWSQPSPVGLADDEDASNPPTPAEAREPTCQVVQPQSITISDGHTSKTVRIGTKEYDDLVVKWNNVVFGPRAQSALPESSPGAGAGVAEKCGQCRGDGYNDGRICLACAGTGVAKPPKPSPSSPAATEGGRLSDEYLDVLIKREIGKAEYNLNIADVRKVARAIEDAARKDEREKHSDWNKLSEESAAVQYGFAPTTPPADAELRETLRQILWQNKPVSVSLDQILPLISSLRAADKATFKEVQQANSNMAERISELEQQVAGRSGGDSC